MITIFVDDLIFWMGLKPTSWRSVRPWFQGPGLAECFGRATTWRFPVPWGKGAISGGGRWKMGTSFGESSEIFGVKLQGTTWNPKQPFINGCFNWMIPNLYIENGCFTNHAFINGCLGFQVYTSPTTLGSSENHWTFLKSDSTLVGGTFRWVGGSRRSWRGLKTTWLLGPPQCSKFWSKKYWYTLW